MRIAFLLALSFTSLAQTLAPLQPVSVARIGIAAPNAQFLAQSVWNGSEHFVVWYDYRGYLAAEPQRVVTHGQAMRISADGTVRQAITLPHRFIPFPGPVWTGSGWIVIGAYSGGTCLDAPACLGGVRLDRNGVVLDQQVRRIALPGAIFHNTDRANVTWTGSHVAIGVRDSAFRPYVVFVNEALEVTSHHQLATTSGGFDGFASDGQTAVVAYRTGAESLAAVFDSEGRLLRKGRLLPDTGNVYGSAFSFAGGRYVLAVVKGDGAFGSFRIAAYTVLPDLTTTALGSSSFTSMNSYGGDGVPPQIIWDGARYNVFTATELQQQHQPVFVAQFAPNGQAPTGSAAHLLDISGVIGAPSINVSGGPGSILFLNAERPAPLQFRLFARVASTVESLATVQAQRLELGAFQQETPAAASHANQSLVAWRERVNGNEAHAVFATRVDARGHVLDDDSLFLGDSSCARAFDVASSGDGFLVAWHDTTTVNATRVGSDGNVGALSAIRRTTSCADTGALTLVGNGADYLAVWTVRRMPTLYDVFALRLRADGSAITPGFIRVGDSVTADVYAASDGRDYLVAWDNRAARVTASGGVLDSPRYLDLGAGRVRFLWWNGAAYVAGVAEGGDTGKAGVLNGGAWRFPRVSPGGSVVFSSAAPLQFAELGTYAMPFAASCNATGCTLPISTTRDGAFGLTLLRLTDDSTNIAASMTTVPNYSRPAPDPVEWPLAAGILDAGRLVIAVHEMRTEAPYHGVHRIFLAPFGTPKQRAVRR
jgi:hypothetical protein